MSRHFPTIIVTTFRDKMRQNMTGDLLDAPPGLSLRHLSRKLTRSIHSKAVNDLWKRRAELEDTLRHQWFRNLPGDSPAQPDSYHGHGNGSTACPASGRPLFLTQSSDWVSPNGLDTLPRARAKDAAEPPRGESCANTSLTPMDDMLHVAPRGSTQGDMIALGI